MSGLHRKDSEMSSMNGMMPMDKGPREKRSRFKSNVADSHAATMEAVSRYAPDIPKEVQNFQTYAVSPRDRCLTRLSLSRRRGRR